jgi:hypothetical protein
MAQAERSDLRVPPLSPELDAVLKGSSKAIDVQLSQDENVPDLWDLISKVPISGKYTPNPVRVRR